MHNQPSLWPAIRRLVDDEPQYVALIAAMVQDFDPDRPQLVNEPRRAPAGMRLNLQAISDIHLPTNLGGP